MSDGPVQLAYRLLSEAVDALAAASSPDELISMLTVCEGIGRRLDRTTVDAVAALERQGVFADRGYRSTTLALRDLLGWEQFEARRRVTAAEQVCERVTLDGSVLPPRLPATAEAFAAANAGLRHVEAVAKVLGSDAAGRLSPEVWAGAETELAARAADYTPTELRTWGTALIEQLDQDGPEPDDRPHPQVNELHLHPHRDRPGGTLTGRFDDAALFDSIAAAVDALAAPRDADEQRPAPQRQAEALADACRFVLDHGDAPETGGRRPHLNVIVTLEELERRARAAMLDFGGTLSPASLRMLACDAAVVPIVMGGAGQPLDVGRATRTVPDGLRRAVLARDRGCAHPGCDRPPSWCEVHHVAEWARGGSTEINNLVALCRVHHRLIHHSEWIVRIRDGLPEFVPPRWVDPRQRPRRKPRPHLVAACSQVPASPRARVVAGGMSAPITGSTQGRSTSKAPVSSIR